MSNLSNANLIVVILAAGLSQRLGFAKQLILKKNQTLLEEKIALALALRPSQVLVVLPKLDTALSAALYQQIRHLPVTIVDNNNPQTGMAQSIQLAVSTLENQHVVDSMRVLFLTVDQIALTYDDLIKLTKPVTDGQLIVSRYDEQSSPTFGIPVNLPFGFLTAFAHQLTGDQGFRALWQNHQELVMKNGKPYQLTGIFLPHVNLDIDTLEDFEKFKTSYGLRLTNI